MSKRRRSRSKGKNRASAPKAVAAVAEPTEDQKIVHRINRAALRRALKFAAYTGAERSRYTDDWHPGSGSADSDLLMDLRELRARSRDLVRNDGIARGVIQTYVDNVIGCGLTPQAKIDAERVDLTPKQARELGNRIERAFSRWSQHASADGRLDWAGLQAMAFAQVLENGDVATVPLMLSDEPWRPYELAVEVIEADRISTPPEHEWDEHVREGVRIGERRGEARSYFVQKAHPGDRYAIGKQLEWVEVAARNRAGRPSLILHYRPRRPQQTRGEPILAPVMRELHDRREYLRAERIAARVSACYAMFITTPDPEGLADATNKDGFTEEIEAGIIQYLAPGEQVQDFKPNRPNNAFDQFLEVNDRTIGVGTNLSYGSITKDTSKANFSNMRTELIQDRRNFRSWQRWWAVSFCQPYYEMFVEEMYLRGELPEIGSLAQFRELQCELARCDWIPDGWDWIDPVKDVQAALLTIEGGIESRSRVIKRRGIDPEQLAEEIERDLELFGEIKSTKPQQSEPNEEEDEEDSDAEDGDEAESEQDQAPVSQGGRGER